MTVSNPCPTEAPPVMTPTLPAVSTLTFTPSDGPSPLFSPNMASPQPTSPPLAQRAKVARSRTRQNLVEQTEVITGIVVNLLAIGVHRARIWHLILADRVDAPNFYRAFAHPRCDRIHQPLANECRLEPPRCA